MSADAHVTSGRLRAPPVLSSAASAQAQRRRAARLGTVSIGTVSSLASSSHLQAGPSGATYRSDLLGSEARLINFVSSSATPFPFNEAGHDGGAHDYSQADTHLDAFAAGNTGQDGATTWLDLDRFEDWDRPTLEALCPDIRIDYEEQIFPIAVAEDGETLPSQLHPSHPYGDVHLPAPPYTTKVKAGMVRHGLGYVPQESAGSPPNGEQPTDLITSSPDMHRGWISGAHAPLDDAASRLPPHLTVRARQSVAPNPPRWPFKRFGPGASGPSALMRSELSRPWRPYRAVWAEMDLATLLTSKMDIPDGITFARQRSNGERTTEALENGPASYHDQAARDQAQRSQAGIHATADEVDQTRPSPHLVPWGRVPQA